MIHSTHPDLQRHGQKHIKTVKGGAVATFVALLLSVLFLSVLLLFSGCVDQHQQPAAAANLANVGNSKNLRIVSTSPVIVEIAEKLDLDLTGTPQSSIAETPQRYANTTKVGAPMSPDLEIIQSLTPDMVLSPVALKADLEPKYQAAGINYFFVDLNSVEGMYASIKELGEMFDRQNEAQDLYESYEQFLNQYQAQTDLVTQTTQSTQTENFQQPRILILMGLPGSYVVATENSYAGSLVKLSGGINVYADETADFLNINAEDMVLRDPDIILRTSHALPDQVMQMFAEEFAVNDTWKHFRAVQNEQVYDLPSAQFGMSATFEYPKALNFLQGIYLGTAK